jgi:hypothetical protein
VVFDIKERFGYSLVYYLNTLFPSNFIMHKKKSIFPILFIMFSCFSGYQFFSVSASGHEKESERAIAASKVDLFNAAKKILVILGFNLIKVDKKHGLLSTEPSPMRLAVDDCECASNLGPVEDTRPIINVSVDIRIEENIVMIRATIHGEYPEDQVTEKMIETDLLDQISRYVD